MKLQKGKIPFLTKYIKLQEGKIPFLTNYIKLQEAKTSFFLINLSPKRSNITTYG